MKIISFIIGIVFSYLIINLFISTKEHGYNSNDIKKIKIDDGNNKYRLIPVTYSCVYDIHHE